MQAEVLWRDEDGNPARVAFDDGFAQWTTNYDPDEHGWVDQMLDPNDFPIIRAGREMEMLVARVNQLQRENFRLKQSEKRWMAACGFGPPKSNPVTNDNTSVDDTAE